MPGLFVFSLFLFVLLIQDPQAFEKQVVIVDYIVAAALHYAPPVATRVHFSPSSASILSIMPSSMAAVP